MTDEAFKPWFQRRILEGVACAGSDSSGIQAVQTFAPCSTRRCEGTTTDLGWQHVLGQPVEAVAQLYAGFLEAAATLLQAMPVGPEFLIGGLNRANL